MGCIFFPCLELPFFLCLELPLHHYFEVVRVFMRLVLGECVPEVAKSVPPYFLDPGLILENGEVVEIVPAMAIHNKGFLSQDLGHDLCRSR